MIKKAFRSGLAVIAMAMYVAAFASAQVLVAPEHAPYQAPYDQSRGVLSYADLLEPVLSSVVRINTIGAEPSQEDVLLGSGSGVVFDAEAGLILTNAHVVRNALLIGVELRTGELVEAAVLGVDTVTDLAVLQADLEFATEVAFVDSSTVRLGDLVFAVGYPRGLDLTISNGLVSGLKRQGFHSSPETPGVEDFIQTDAPINPGNSGGPLMDSRGRVIGINTFIFKDSDGIGFAVPSNIAVIVARKLAEKGRIERGYLGINVETLTPSRAEALGIAYRSGALITLVEPGSPAAQAGLRPGDVITGFPNLPVAGALDVVNFVLLADPGKPYRIYYRRNDEALIGEIVPKVRPGSEPETNAPPQTVSQPNAFGAQIGDRLRNPDAGDATEIRILEIAPGSPAERKGLKAGDVIVSLNQVELRNTKDLLARMEALGSETAALLVRRGEVKFLALFGG